MRRGVDSGQKVPLPHAYKTSKSQDEYAVAPPLVSEEKYEERIRVLATQGGRRLVTEDGKAFQINNQSIVLTDPPPSGYKDLEEYISSPAYQNTQSKP